MLGKVVTGGLATLVAFLAAVPSALANDYTELRICEAEADCESVASVPVGVANLISNFEDTACAAPLTVPIDPATEVRVCERSTPFPDPRRTLAFVRLIAGGHDVALESVANGGALISDYSIGARVDDTRIQLHTACSSYPQDPSQPDSRCVP